MISSTGWPLVSQYSAGVVCPFTFTPYRKGMNVAGTQTRNRLREVTTVTAALMSPLVRGPSF